MEKLVDKIYEAAVLPDGWKTVLNDISDRFGGKGGVLFTSSSDKVRWLGAGESEQTFADFVAEGWAPRNDRVPRLVQMGYPGFVTDTDVYTAAEIAERPMYTEFLFPRGYIAAAASAIQGATGDTLIFSIEGFQSEADARATFGLMDSIRPHIARSAMLSSQMQLERAKAAVTALELVGAPSAFITDTGRLVAANDRFNALLGKRVLDSRRHLSFADVKVDKLFRESLHLVRSKGIGRSIPLPASGNSARGILHVVPVRGDARDIFASDSAIVVMAGYSTPSGLSQELLQGLFDLTPAEARLARGLLEGLTAQEAAQRFQVTEGTVRTQLKALFCKTGQTRQADLIRLLASFAILVGS